MRAAQRNQGKRPGGDTVSAAVDGGRDPDAPPTSGRAGAAGDTPSAQPPSLKAAIRSARVEDAERSQAVSDLRGIELARLDVLKEALEPVLAQVPAGIDLFDLAIMPGLRPRLFIDMIGFVEMNHDKRGYRFLQDTREGRVTLCESDRLDAICQAVTGYIARRLVEREKALASSGGGPAAALAPARPSLIRRLGRLALEYLGIVALVVLCWVLGDALYHWALTARR